MRAAAPMHGKTSLVAHDGTHLFAGLAPQIEVGRYHSLVIPRDALPQGFVRTAWVVDDGTIMGVRHETWPVFGVQFHPESVLTLGGAPAAAELPGDAVTMFAPLLEKLRRHEDLTSDEAAQAMGAIMDGQAQPAHIAGLLMALALKGERPGEMVGLRAGDARAGRAAAGGRSATCSTRAAPAATARTRSTSRPPRRSCSPAPACASPSTATARCRAAAASADVFEALGVELEAPPDRVVAGARRSAGLAFFFAPAWHPSMRHAGPTRRELGVRTAFNLLGPLTNPAGARRQLVGVSRPEHTELVARTLGLLGAERAWVVHGAGGLDEISTLGHTKVSELRDGTVNTFYVHPADVGLPLATRERSRRRHRRRRTRR